MSIMGTGVAAGVAQTGLQAQQVAQARDKRARDAKRPLSNRTVADVYEPHEKVAEEHDDSDAAPRLVVDDQKALGEHPPPPEQQPAQAESGDEQAERAAAAQRPRLDLTA
jgi:hypothetical protein